MKQQRIVNNCKKIFGKSILENYKNAWSNQPEETTKFSAIEIYKMSHSKSSSIVKWIFIIGILELLLWSGLNLLIPESFYKVYEDLKPNSVKVKTDKNTSEYY